MALPLLLHPKGVMGCSHGWSESSSATRGMEVPLSPFLKSSSLPRWGGGAHSLTQTALRSLRPDISLTSQSSPNGLRTPSLHSSCPLALRRLAFLTVPTQQNQPKRRLPRLRAVMKWSGLTLCVLLFALWLASGWWEVTFPPKSRYPDSLVIIDLGRLHLCGPMYVSGPVGLSTDELRQQEKDKRVRSLEADIEAVGWTVRSDALFDSIDAWRTQALARPQTPELSQMLITVGGPLDRSQPWHWWDWGCLRDPGRGRMWITFPLYLPFLLIALPTGFLFYRDRKVRPGLCAICRYDLRGLPETTMRCPECGACVAESKENTS